MNKFICSHVFNCMRTIPHITKRNGKWVLYSNNKVSTSNEAQAYVFCKYLNGNK